MTFLNAVFVSLTLSCPQSAHPTGTQGLLAIEPDSPVMRLLHGSLECSLSWSSLRTLFTKQPEAAGVSYGTKFAQTKTAAMPNF